MGTRSRVCIWQPQCWPKKGCNKDFYLSIYLSVCLSFFLSVFLSIYLTIYLSIYPSIIINLSTYLSLFIYHYLSLCFAASLTFRAPVSAFFYLLSRPLFYSSLLCFSSFQIVGSLTPKLPLKYIHFIVSHIVIDDDQRPCGQVFSTFGLHQTLRAHRL